MFPRREDCEMVSAWRHLLKYIVANVAFVFPAFLGQTFEQILSFVFTWWRNVNMRHNAKRIARRRSLGIADSKTVMHPLIVGAAMDGLELRPELQGLLCPFTVVELRRI